MLVLAFFLVCQCNVLQKVRVPEYDKITNYIQLNNEMSLFVAQCFGKILRTAGRIVVSHDFQIIPLKHSWFIHICHENDNKQIFSVCTMNKSNAGHI